MRVKHYQVKFSCTCVIECSCGVELYMYGEDFEQCEDCGRRYETRLGKDENSTKCGLRVLGYIGCNKYKQIGFIDIEKDGCNED